MIIESSNSYSQIFVGINKFFETKNNIQIINTNSHIWEIFKRLSNYDLVPKITSVSMTMMPNLYVGFGKQSIYWVHDLLFFEEEMVFGDNKNRFKLQQENLLKGIERAKLIVVPTYHVKQKLKQLIGISDEKIFVQYCQIDPEKYLIKRNSKEINNSVLHKFQLVGKKYIVFIGSPHYRKNLKNVLLAFDQLKKEINDLILVVISYRRKDIDNTANLYDQILLRNDIKLLSGLTQEDLISIMSEGQLLLSPSLEEGFGLPNIEAQLCGLPVVSSNISCIPEVLGSSAILVNPLEINEIVSACSNILHGRISVQNLKTKGYKNSKRFSNINRYEILYEKMLELNGKKT